MCVCVCARTRCIEDNCKTVDRIMLITFLNCFPQIRCGCICVSVCVCVCVNIVDHAVEFLGFKGVDVIMFGKLIGLAT